MPSPEMQDRTIPSDAEVRTIAFSKDGRLLVGICDDGKLRQWDVQSGAVHKVLAWNMGEYPVALPSGAGLFAVMSQDGTISLRNLEGADSGQRIRGPQSRVRNVAISSDARMFAASTRVAGNG